MLAEFRAKVAEGGLEQVVLDRLLERLAAGGLVRAAGRQRQLHAVEAAVASLNRLELAGIGPGGAGGAVRRAAALAGAADLRTGFHPPLRHPDDVVAAPAVAEETR